MVFVYKIKTLPPIDSQYLHPFLLPSFERKSLSTPSNEQDYSIFLLFSLRKKSLLCSHSQIILANVFSFYFFSCCFQSHKTVCNDIDILGNGERQGDILFY